MTTLADAYQAGIDAVVADNALNRGGFADAVRTVITANFSNADATGWIDAIAAEYNRLNQINNPTYNNLRGHIIADPAIARALFDAVSTVANLPESFVAGEALDLIDLRADRDEVNTSIDTLLAFKTGATRQVKDALQLGIDQLRAHKQDLRNQIQAITGDPDST